MLVNYSVQCPEGDLAFLNITTLELEEPNCNDIARCASKLQLYICLYSSELKKNYKHLKLLCYACKTQTWHLW